MIFVILSFKISNFLKLDIGEPSLSDQQPSTHICLIFLFFSKIEILEKSEVIFSNFSNFEIGEKSLIRKESNFNSLMFFNFA